jgi:hypothetical protein
LDGLQVVTSPEEGFDAKMQSEILMHQTHFIFDLAPFPSPQELEYADSAVFITTMRRII